MRLFFCGGQCIMRAFGSLAQLVEHWTFNPLVPRSSRGRPTRHSPGADFSPKKTPHRRGFFLLESAVLFTLTRAIYFQAITHIGFKVFECLVLITLGLERFGTYLLVTATVAAVQGTHAVPLGVIRRPLVAEYRETSGMTDCRAQDVSTNVATGVMVVAIRTGHVELAALGVKVLLALVVGLNSTVVVRHLDVKLLAA